MDAARQVDADPIVIRSAEPEDAAAISAVFGTPGTVEGTLQLPDMPVASRVEYLQKVEPAACKLVAVAEGLVVGCASLHSPSNSLRRSHSRMLGIGILPQWQGRGVGRKLLARLLDWADNWGNVLRVELHVHADNERAIALYRSMGFVEEGRHRAYALKNGRFIDSFSMARLHPNQPLIG